MRQYLELLRHVREKGAPKRDRTGVGTVAAFGWQMRFDLAEGFPLVTTKRLHLKSIVHELLWFLRGETNARSLQDVGVRIWDQWADADGNLGPGFVIAGRVGAIEHPQSVARARYTIQREAYGYRIRAGRSNGNARAACKSHTRQGSTVLARAIDSMNCPACNAIEHREGQTGWTQPVRNAQISGDSPQANQFF